jgi:hypothetical protein
MIFVYASMGLRSEREREREREIRERRVSPALWLEEPKPDAIGVVSGSGVGVLPVGLR